MRKYVRRLRVQLHHRYDEFFEATKGRRDCPFEVQLRGRLVEATRDMLALAEACLEELRRQEVMFYAPFKPGERVVVEYSAAPGAPQRARQYLITDVMPDKRGGFHYEVWELTKKGTLHARRAPHWLFPRSFSAMRRSEAPVCEDAEQEARYFRECARTSRALAFEKGDLTLFERVEGNLGSHSFRRKDRMSV
jgi:hypothetical protein